MQVTQFGKWLTRDANSYSRVQAMQVIAISSDHHTEQNGMQEQGDSSHLHCARFLRIIYGVI